MKTTVEVKKMKHFVLVTLVIASLALGACAASAAPSAPVTVSAEYAEAALVLSTSDVLLVDAEESTSIDPTALEQSLAAIAVGTLTETESADLAYMREEEKLAHDVYIALYEKWGLSVFQNIAASEQTHTDAVKRLLDRYGLEDPAAGNSEGEFTSQTLQNLYDQLIEQGSLSIADALKVGAAIEEIDILDLEERIAQTDKADITRVYTNLLNGSQNHLRAFVSTLKTQTGETYAPQYLSQAAYDAIVGSSLENGGRGGRGGR
jgi:hypothetical protein